MSTKKSRKELDLLNDDILKIFKRFIITGVSGMLMLSFYILVDTICIGWSVGSEGLAALNIALPIYNVMAATGLLLGIGGATALSVTKGQGKSEKLNDIFTHTVITAIIISALFILFGNIFINQISYFLGANDNNISLVKEYLIVLINFSFAFIMSSTLSAFSRNDNAPKVAMYTTIFSGVLNIILDVLFMFVFNWGMFGAAIATGISSLLGMLILIMYFIKGKTLLKIVKCKFQLDLLRRISSNGFSSFVLEMSTGVVIFLFNIALLRVIGEIGISAYSIIANISIICVSIFTGISNGMQPIISINYGANRLDRVYKVRRLGLYASIFTGCLFYCIGILFPRQIISLFTKVNSELISITSIGIKYYFIAFLFMGANIVLGVYFQSIEAAKTSTFISMLRGIIFIVAGLAFLPSLFGIIGVWITVPIAEIITLCIAILLLILQRQNNLVMEN